MNLRQLRYFTKVVETGNITKAAETLNVAQPALGLQIRQLEQELKVPLLVRHSRGVDLTAAGRLLYDRATAILLSVETAQQEVVALAGAERQTIRLGLSPNLMALIGPDVILMAREKLPNLHLSLAEGLSFSLVDCIERDELDLAFAYDADERGGLARTLLLEEELALVTLPNEMPPGDVPFAQILEKNLVLAGSRDSVRRVLEAAAQQLSLAVIPAFEIQSVAATISMVSRGLGVAVVPRGTVVEQLTRGELEAHSIVWPFLIRRLYLVRGALRPRLRYENALVAIVTEKLQMVAAASEGHIRMVPVDVRNPAT